MPRKSAALERGAGFKSLHDSCADTTTAGRLMLTILGGLAEFERELSLRAQPTAEPAPRSWRWLAQSEAWRDPTTFAGHDLAAIVAKPSGADWGLDRRS